MRLSFNIRLRLLAFFFFLGGALILTSCSDDDLGYDVGINEVKEVTVRLNISAGEVGDISVTRADDYDGSYVDANALDGEYMNTLCVFVVDASGVIVEKRTPATSDDGWEGKWPEWTSDALTLTTGIYTVYAFSNWETVNNTSWNAIINREADGSTTLTDEDLNIDIEDPASLVDIENGMYIPMSGKQEITVEEGSKSFDVGMDRLVGRVDVTIYGESGTDAQDVTLNSFTFGSWADIEPLMKDGTTSETITYNGKHTETFTDGTILKAVNTTEGSTEENLDTKTFHFYVNETDLGTDGNFEITLTTTRGTDLSSSTYSAHTIHTSSIPRNYILPIYLTLSPYTLNLDVTAYVAPIGAAETPYTNYDVDQDTYAITLLDNTTKFVITPSIFDSTDSPISETVKWTWVQTESDFKTEETSGLLAISDPDNGMYTFTNLTATTGYKYYLVLTATWENSSGVTFSREYHIEIELINERPKYNSPAHSSWQGWYWNKEQLNMYRIH